MGKTGNSNYNPAWEDSQLYPELSPWVKSVDTGNPDDVHWFQCKVCKNGKIKLSNMGVGALKKHMTDPKPKPGQPRKKCKHNQRMESIKIADKTASKQSHRRLKNHQHQKFIAKNLNQVNFCNHKLMFCLKMCGKVKYYGL